MAESAVDFADSVVTPLERADARALWDLSRNLEAHIQNTLRYVEETSEVRESTQAVHDTVRRLIQETPAFGDAILVEDMPPDLHTDALEKARWFREAVRSAPASGLAKALLGG